MGTSIGRINLDLGVNTSGFKKELNGATKAAKSAVGGMSSSLGKIGKMVAVAFSVKAIVSFSKECLQLGSDLAEVQNVVDVTFGSMSSKVNEFAKNAMTSFGLSEKVAKDYMGQFGAMSKAFGNTEAMAYDQAAALTGLAGDVASFYNMTTDEAFTKLKAVYTGETEALKSLGVVMTQAALDEFALQKGIGKTTAKMSEQEKVALRLSFVQDRLAGATGDFIRTADGWANQTRVLSLRFDALKASIGQGLINALLPVIRLLNELMVYLQKAADTFRDFMEAIFGTAGGSSGGTSLGDSLASGSGALADNMDSAAGSAKAIKKSLAGFDQINIIPSNSSGGASGAGSSSGSMGGSGGSGDGGVNAGAVSAAEKLKGFLKDIKTELINIANITGLAGLWTDFKTSVENVKGGVTNLWASFKTGIDENALNIETFKTTLSETFTAMSQTITTIWGEIWTSCSLKFKEFTEENKTDLDTFFTNVIESVSGYGTLISGATGDIFTAIKDWWEENGKPVFDGFLDAIKDVWGWVLDIWNIVIFPVIKSVQEALSGLWDDSANPLFKDLLSAISELGALILHLWNSILKPVIDWLIQTFGPQISLMVQGIVKIIFEAISGIIRIVDGLLTVLRGIIEFLTGVFTGDWGKAWNGIVGVFVGIWDTIGGIFATIFNPILSAFETVINGAIGGINWLIRQANKIPGIDLGEISKVTLPRLANGGYVEANTPQLAIIGDNKREGEIVAPESKIAEAVAKGFATVMSKLNQNSGGKQPIYLTVKLGDNDFWHGFVDYHNSVVKCTGESPLLI